MLALLGSLATGFGARLDLGRVWREVLLRSIHSSCEALSRQCDQEEQEYLRLYPPIASTIVNSSPMQPPYVSTSP
ncbi:hypothetical protein WME73_08505 [Sorangium sp. So ce302]